MSEPPDGLAAFQEAFAQALLGGSAEALSPYLVEPEALRRFAVYRNNFVAAAVGALEKNFPSTGRLIGEKFFRQAARAHVYASPPRDRALTLYGEGFPERLAAAPGARHLSYLRDVALLDRTFLEALFAPDHPSLAPEALAGLDADAVAARAPGLHASARVSASAYPAYAIWRACREEDEPQPVDAALGAQTALLWRVGDNVRHRALTPGEAAFFLAIEAGGTFGAAAERGLAAEPGFDVAVTLAGALASGVFAAPTPSEDAFK